MKLDQNSTSRPTYDNAGSPAGAGTESSPLMIGPQANPLRVKDQASLTEQARLLAKARTSLDQVDEQHKRRARLLKEQVAKGAYEIPVDALARLLAPRFKLNQRGQIEDEGLIGGEEQ